MIVHQSFIKTSLIIPMATGLRIDNSKRIAGMLNLLKSGKDLFDSAPSYDEKKRGLVKCVEGMKELKIVIELEQGPNKEYFQKLLDSNNREISSMIDRLETEKSGQGQPVAMK